MDHHIPHITQRFYKQLLVGCTINIKLPSCVDKIHRTSLGALKALLLWTPGHRENLMMYIALYKHTRVVLYMYKTHSKLI